MEKKVQIPLEPFLQVAQEENGIQKLVESKLEPWHVDVQPTRINAERSDGVL